MAASAETGGEDSGLGVPTAPPGVSGFTGAATYQFPIPVPPGRAGIAPNISLAYNSLGRNGRLGVGWDLDLGSIQRRTKDGLTYSGSDYTKANDYVATINGSQSELVPRSDWGADTFESKIEGAFMRFRITGRDATLQPVSWEVTTKEGTPYLYGSSTSSTQFHAGSDNFRWYLDKVRDLNGNTMSVSYSLDNSVPYPTAIQYTGWEDSPVRSADRLHELQLQPVKQPSFLYSCVRKRPARSPIRPPL